MNESNEKKSSPMPPKKPAILAALEAEDGIPIRNLKFHRATGVDIPGQPGASGIRVVAPQDTVGDRYEIMLLPRLRHFRCTYVPGNKEKPRVVFYVHETWATWEPIAQ